MSFKSNKYKDREKWREIARNWKRRYRAKTGSGEYEKRKWEQWEIDAIIERKVSDRELSKKIMRSVTSIQVKRSKINKRLTRIKESDRLELA